MKTTLVLMMVLTVLAFSTMACGQSAVTDQISGKSVSGSPQWYRDTLLLVGLLVGLKPTTESFFLYSGLTFQLISGLATLIILWMFTAKLTGHKDAFRYGFYVSALAAVMVCLAQGWMMISFRWGILVFIVEILAALIIGFVAVGGRLNYKGPVHKMVVEPAENCQVARTTEHIGATLTVERK